MTVRKITPVAALLLVVFTAWRADAAGGDSTISAPYRGFPIVISTHDRLAGGIGSLKWKGTELLNNPPEYLRGIGANVILNRQGFCENPNDGGSRNDYFKPSSTSKLLSLKAHGNVLESSKQMAYWLGPGQSDTRCGTARNTAALSNLIINRRVSIGVNGVDNAIEFKTAFALPEDRNNAYFVPLGVHAAGFFRKFYTFDRHNNSLTELSLPDRTQQHKRMPVVTSTADGTLAIGVFSPAIPEQRRAGRGNEAYTIGNWTQARNPTTKLNCAFFDEPAPASTYTFTCYVLVGSLSDVTEGMAKLSAMFPQPQR
jgi:hypothetical protein